MTLSYCNMLAYCMSHAEGVCFQSICGMHGGINVPSYFRPKYASCAHLPPFHFPESHVSMGNLRHFQILHIAPSVASSSHVKFPFLGPIDDISVIQV